MQDNTKNRTSSNYLTHTPDEPSYQLAMFGERDGGAGLQVVELAREEYISLKQHLGALRAELPAPGGELVTQAELHAVVMAYLLVESMAYRLWCRINAGAKTEAGLVTADIEGVSDPAVRIIGAEIGGVHLDWGDMVREG